MAIGWHAGSRKWIRRGDFKCGLRTRKRKEKHNIYKLKIDILVCGVQISAKLILLISFDFCFNQIYEESDINFLSNGWECLIKCNIYYLVN